jgi:hypothetical protein
MTGLQRLLKWPKCALRHSARATPALLPRPNQPGSFSRPKSTVSPSSQERVGLADQETAELEAAKRIRERDITDVYTSKYPRLVHGSNPISAPEFNSEYEGREEFDSSTPEVTVYGEVLSFPKIQRTHTNTFKGRIASKRQHGKYFLFVDVVNEFDTIQAMVSWQSVEAASKVTKPKFFLFTKLIERGDHICMYSCHGKKDTKHQF